MELIPVEKVLTENPYPGRGIVIGNSADGEKAVVAYFIMGRSENSRNRIFVEDGDGIRTQAYDLSKVSDPSLIIYAPVRVFEKRIIVTNGDQTDTIYNGLAKKLTFEQSLRIKTFEPDAPNYTPRISGMVHLKKKKFEYKLSIIKSDNGHSEAINRFTFSYEMPIPGEGRLIHTYIQDGDPLPSYEGEPKRVAIQGDIDVFTQNLWQGLNEENKVSLFVRFVDIASKKVESRIVNKLITR